jgi:hypothetical protein
MKNNLFLINILYFSLLSFFILVQDFARADEAPVKLLTPLEPSTVVIQCSSSDRKEARQRHTDESLVSIITCDYKHSSSIQPEKVDVAVDGETVSLEKSDIRFYPAKNQTTAIMLLFDVSDPARGRTVDSIYPQISRLFSRDLRPHQTLGIATFAETLEYIPPIEKSPSDPEPTSPNFSAKGRATELFRLTKEALKDFEKNSQATRRILVLVSDGKDEDTAYHLEEVVATSRKSDIPIFAVGIAERPAEFPKLQSLRKLAEDSGGRFLDLSSKKIPDDLPSQVTQVVETGGRISFPAARFFGKREIRLVLTDTHGIKAKGSFELDFPDQRDWKERAIAFSLENALILATAFFAMIGVAWAFFQRKPKLEPQTEFQVSPASLTELDGLETVHQLFGNLTSIGREKGNDVVLANSSVSARHASVSRDRDGNFRAVDLGSTNGILINGIPVQTGFLTDGDELEIGEVRFRFNVIRNKLEK